VVFASRDDSFDVGGAGEHAAVCERSEELFSYADLEECVRRWVIRSLTDAALSEPLQDFYRARFRSRSAVDCGGNAGWIWFERFSPLK
jgi:hypothetical protein